MPAEEQEKRGKRKEAEATRAREDCKTQRPKRALAFRKFRIQRAIVKISKSTRLLASIRSPRVTTHHTITRGNPNAVVHECPRDTVLCKKLFAQRLY